MGVVPLTDTGSVHRGLARPVLSYATFSMARISSRCWRLTGVTPAVNTGSVQENGSNPAATSTSSIRARSSVKCTALTGVTPGTSGSSVKGTVTVTVNLWFAEVFDPPMSVAHTVTVAVPGATGVTVILLPETVTDATAGAEEAAA